MRKWLIILLILMAVLSMGYYAMVKIVLPGAASAFVPVKWQNIPLGQQHRVFEQYLGVPDQRTGQNMQWISSLSANKRYLLNVEYAADGIAKEYSIVYETYFLGFRRHYPIRKDSIP